MTQFVNTNSLKDTVELIKSLNLIHILTNIKNIVQEIKYAQTSTNKLLFLIEAVGDIFNAQTRIHPRDRQLKCTYHFVTYTDYNNK